MKRKVRCLPVEKRKFLGYQILKIGILKIAIESIKRLKDKVRVITKRNRSMALERIIDELNHLIPGWIRYFKLAERAKSTLINLDSWIRRKIRCYRLKQFKRLYTIANELQKMGSHNIKLLF